MERIEKLFNMYKENGNVCTNKYNLAKLKKMIGGKEGKNFIVRELPPISNTPVCYVIQKVKEGLK